MSYSVFVKMYMRDAMMMSRLGMYMRMTFMSGTSEKPADLMRSEIGYYLETFLEFIGYSFEMMCLHDRKHYFLVDGKRHVEDRKSVV